MSNTNKLIDLDRLSRFWDEVKTYIGNHDSSIIDKIYPVGSIYMSVTDSTVASVEARFGGTWVAFGSGKTLVGVDTTDTSFDTVEETGGSKTVNLQHSHGFASGTTVGDTTLTGRQSGIQKHTHTVSADAQYEVTGTQTKNITGGSHKHTVGISSSSYSKVYQQFGGGGVASGNAYTAPVRDGDRAWGGETSEVTHTHSLPAHTHTISLKSGKGLTLNNTGHTDAIDAHNHSLSGVSTNNKLSTTQNIMNPYITVYMYKRTA